MISSIDIFSKDERQICDSFNPDNVFKKFQMIEFPITLVGLSSRKVLDVEVDLTTSAYLKTMCENRLMKFKHAREISASHRAFDIVNINNQTIAITFAPRTECISKMKQSKRSDNRFVFDLRLIQVCGTRCCYNEYHSEIGRYYICGEYEYCNITHHPPIIDFGDVLMNKKVVKYVRIRNESHSIAVKINHVKLSGFEVTPQNVKIFPNSSRRISIAIRPSSLLMGKKLTFHVHNPYNDSIDIDENQNFLTYYVKIKTNIVYDKYPKEVVIESLHKLNEHDFKYTYLNKESDTYIRRKNIAKNFLQISTKSLVQKSHCKLFYLGKDKCSLDIPPVRNVISNFCENIKRKITTYGLFDILFIPFSLEFGRVGFSTYGEKNLTIKNNSKYDIVISLLNDDCITYTKDRLRNFAFKLKSSSEIQLAIYCWGCVHGSYSGTFVYCVDDKYYRKHPYHLQVGDPTLMVLEKCIKFGMVTSESFVTSVPIRIHNYFNVEIKFTWDESHADTPFEVIPSTGTVAKNTCKICDLLYICKSTKTKTHEIDLLTESTVKKIIPLELSVITRKLAIKFIQPAVMFKDIALNVETIEKVKLENSSREIALFYVVEPLIPGLRIEPMNGTIRPKTVITFEIIVKISCVIEFSFDVHVRINNKENVILLVSGNVVEPKLIIQPKLLHLPRIPCNMIAYVPVTFQNVSNLKSYIEVMDTGDENIFKVYVAQGNEKQRLYKFSLEGGQSKTVFLKIYDIFRREYEMYIPFKVNGLLGPPDFNTWTTELQHYIGEYELLYEDNPKVRLKTLNKDIAYCRIAGVITVPWIELSVNDFEIHYEPLKSNSIQFSMINVSKYYLYVTIITSKLLPNFSLDLMQEENQLGINDSNIKFELDRHKEVQFSVKFHPKSHGRFVSTALLFLDKHMTIPYYNLTFIGIRQTPALTPSTHRVVFPPCHVNSKVTREITLLFDDSSDLDSFTCMSKEETSITVKFLDSKQIQNDVKIYTIVTVEIKGYCQSAYSRNITLTFNHECGSGCDVEISFCFTYCPLTLHTANLVSPRDNPYPYYPLVNQINLYEYLEKSSTFLEKWMFQQGFRRDLFPVIPDTFHTISSAISAPSNATKTKGINVSYLNFVRRIAGPLMKHVRKISVTEADESFKCVKEIHDTYKEIINLLLSRGANLSILKAKFLLSHDQFLIYTENVTPKSNADMILNKELSSDEKLFRRLNKQSWIDFILQSYKVFVMDSCFFDCVCVSSQSRDIVKVLIDWYNEQIALQHNTLRGKKKRKKVITNITTDLCDGIAIASSILNYCAFFKEHYLIFCDIDENERVGAIINNACLNIEAMNMLRLYFPLQSLDFLEPNFIQMLFLSVHLYVVLPMFKPKDTIKFNPPLLRSSTRLVAISPSSQESLIFNYIIINNTRNNFSVEKAPSGENGKKIFLSVKYIANFTEEEKSILLVHGYNKTRIFDTYMIFLLHGHIGSLNPVRKCKVTGPLYRPNKVDVLVSSPFLVQAKYQVLLSDNEPTIPVHFEDSHKSNFFLRRLNVIDNEIVLSGLPKDSGQDVPEHKLYLQMICLSTQIGNSWIWFRSHIGEFFVKVTSQPRWDLAIDTLQSEVRNWPMDPCSCGEACECYRTTVLVLPHRNELMIKSLRYALMEYASEIMLEVYDRLIETPTGRIILSMLLVEGGTNMSEIQHILRNENSYRITSRALVPRIDRVKLAHHSSAILALPVTIPAHDKSEKYSITFSSDCGMDIRTYKIIFIESSELL